MNDTISKESVFLGAALAGVAFLLTFIAGIVSGVSFGLILLRTFLFSLLLFVLGGVLGILLQRFVPDIWDNSRSASVASETDDEPGYTPPPAGGIDLTVGGGESASGYTASGPSLSMPESEGSVEEEPKPVHTNKNNQVVGNYRIINDKKFPDDPEQYAKAVRTMLKKDD